MKPTVLVAVQALFQQTGVLWMAREQDPYTTATEGVLQKAGAV